MHTKAEGNIIARIRPSNIYAVCVFKHALITITRVIPHHNLVALLNCLLTYVGVIYHRAAHMRKRCLPANDLRNGIVQKVWILSQFGKLLGKLMKSVNAGAHGIARSVIAANNQQQQITQEI